MTMHIEFLVEERSAEVALENLLPKMLVHHTYNVHPYQGKPDLLPKLLGRLRGYKAWLPDDWRIVVLIDNDGEDCVYLKGKLEEAARNAGFISKSAAGNRGQFQIMNRLAVEELEAWFFGDIDAVVAAYPGVPESLGSKAKYRDPDAIAGGTWEALERVLQRAGYYASGLPKVETARKVSEHMDPHRNRSKSFQVFRNGLYELVQ